VWWQTRGILLDIVKKLDLSVYLRLIKSLRHLADESRVDVKVRSIDQSVNTGNVSFAKKLLDSCKNRLQCRCSVDIWGSNACFQRQVNGR
jgi:hypothetical protein